MKELIGLSVVLTVSMAAYQTDAVAQSKMTLVCTAIGSNAPEVLDCPASTILSRERQLS